MARGKKTNIKRQRKHCTSRGARRLTTAKREIRHTKMKIARWKRNQTDEAKKEAGENRGPKGNWDTSGLERHIKTMEKVIKKGRKTYTKRAR